MPASLDQLDAQECLYLAMDCAKRDAHGESIMYLKRCLELKPDEARACYFLGAEYAQIGLLDRAVKCMHESLQMDPTMGTARFQLGLLYFGAGQLSDAQQTWAGLEEFGEENSLQLFRLGLEALARDEFETCRNMLQKGMVLNTANPPLNGDMQKVLDALSNLAPGISGPSEPENASNIFLSSYRDTTH